MKPTDKLPPKPVNGINKSDGPGSYKGYKVGNYASPPEVVVADVESAVAEAEPAVAEPGTAADSSNAVPSSMPSSIADSASDLPLHTVAARASDERPNLAHRSSLPIFEARWNDWRGGPTAS